MKVQELMTWNVVLIEADSTVLQAAELMQEKDVGSVLVVEGGRLAGMLSNRSIINKVVAPALDPASVTVRQFMRTDLVSARPDDDVRATARYLQELKIRRLPVTDENGAPIGVISVSDIAHFIKYYIDCILEEADQRVERRNLD